MGERPRPGGEMVTWHFSPAGIRIAGSILSVFFLSFWACASEGEKGRECSETKDVCSFFWA